MICYALTMKLPWDRCQWSGVNIGLGNGLVPSDNGDPDLYYAMTSRSHNELISIHCGKPEFMPSYGITIITSMCN